MVKRIIWAIDAFEEKPASRTKIVDLLKSISERTHVKIEPVYVLSPDQLDLALEFSPEWTNHYKPAAEKALAKMLSETKIAGLLEPKVLVQRRPSLRNGVKALVQYASRSRADLLVVGTHGRSNFSRVLIGSFAEEILLQATKPVLVIGPETDSRTLFGKILFATDLESKSKPVFRKVVALAKGLGSTVTLLHVVRSPMAPVIQSGVYLLGGGWVPVPVFLGSQEKVLKKEADQWIAEAKKHGVKANAMVLTQEQATSEAILKVAHDGKFSVVAMAAQSGRAASALIGSVTRQVVRHSECPTWVVRV